MKSLLYFFLPIGLILLIAGCTKQTLATKPYHNLTGRYNAYYNANLRVTESFETLDAAYQDNYNQLLPMYTYIAIADANSVKQKLDEAITKCARNIKLHTIGNWTDDSYHLMGKAEFLQREYERAANTFKYVVDKYHPENIQKEEAKLKKQAKKKRGKKVKRKKKKRRSKKKRRKRSSKKKKSNKKSPKGEDTDEEDEKPVNYGIKHRPVRYKSMLWLAKTYIELKQYDEAGYYLRQMENDMKVPYKLRPEVQAVTAHYWISQKEYTKAIEPLTKAVEGTKNKGIKNRYVYILAQLHQMQGSNQLAMENFHKVLRLRPSYTMEFNARLNMAKNAANVGGKTPIDPELALQRMLKDSKNDEYKDQIYFALAEVKLKSGNTEDGIAALQKSLNYTQSNSQRAEGCLLLAELFYKKDDFVASYAYYDSTLMAMNKKDERYVSTELRKKRLQGVATHLAVVEEKDSLLVVGSWEREDQEAWAIKEMEADERRLSRGLSALPTQAANSGKEGFRNLKVNSANAINEGSLPRRTNNVRSSNTPVKVMDAMIQKSKFALYNANLKKKGEREFEKRWNNRAWVDNWRRADRASDESEEEEGDLATVTPKTQEEITDYLNKRGVPNSEQAKRQMNTDLGEAMFKAAEHYREDLGRNDKALALIEDLIKRYPSNTYAVEALFLAYNIYNEEKNSSKADAYKNRILNNYPDSKIAQLLSDPDFANSERIKYEAVNKYYDETYELIQSGKPEAALDRVRAVPTKFGNSYEMKARFAILEAMCIGGMKGEKDYVKALRVIVTSFPNTEEEKQAKAMIAVLSGGKKAPVSDNSGDKKPKVPYKVNKNSRHMVLIYFNDKKVRVSNYRAEVTKFNKKFFLSKPLSVSSILVDRMYPTITVRSFSNAEEAMKYVTEANANKEFLPGAKGYTVYAISQTNYNLAMSTLQFSQYATFFEEHYR